MSRESIAPAGSMDSGLVLRTPRNDESGRPRVTLRPHPEEHAIACASKDGPESRCCVHPSRRGQTAAPQDEVSRLFDAKNLCQVICLSSPLRKNISVHFWRKSLLYPPPSRPTQRGVSRSSRT